MTKPDGKVDANRTMQIDLNDVRNELELSDVDPATLAAAFAPVSERARKSHAPPPLPPLPPVERVPVIDQATSTSAAGARSSRANADANTQGGRRPAFYLGIVAVLLVVGVGVGAVLARATNRAPNASNATSTSSATGTTASPSARVGAPAAPTVIGIPTVEIADTPATKSEGSH